MEAHKFCRKCGKPLEEIRVFAGSYSRKDGLPIYFKRYKCPARKIFLDGHDYLREFKSTGEGETEEVEYDE